MNQHIVKIVITFILASATPLLFAQDSAFKYARIDSAADFNRFKTEAESSVTNNKRIIDQLKVHKTKGDNESRAKFRSDVSALEDKNEELAIKIAVADMVTTNAWATFKRDFSKEMNELINILKETSDNYLIY